ncbi:MAG: FixH family protein [Sulfurimonas sp.]|jgi:hypothetical protein|uniref:FixH family protein n=1 Tax=Sulfurimonas sp. TaxID=2022749 RepID=UPI002D17D1C8|nr:FixH family protein [Sulfurimonas sp.]HUH42879.1 FixH family protein [Sulfurimonas sp.]
MMKTVLGLILVWSFAQAEGFMDMKDSDGLHAMLSSTRVLSEGENKIKVELNRGEHGGAVVDAKEVRIKFFMPQMPGMPYMESKDICKKVDGSFECNINFAMSGTWQYQLFVKDETGKDYKYKGSVNLGQASSMHHNN